MISHCEIAHSENRRGVEEKGIYRKESGRQNDTASFCDRKEAKGKSEKCILVSDWIDTPCFRKELMTAA